MPSDEDLMMTRATAISFIIVVLLTLPSCAVESSADGGAETWRRGVIERISGAEIMTMVEHLEAFGTREFHTEQAWQAAGFILDRMQSLGMDAALQEFDVGNITSANVVATLNADKTEDGVYVIGAHYDSENYLVTNQSEAENVTAPGADDNASGVSAMLEIARVLSEEGDFTAAVTFVAFGAEERGYDGSGGIAGSEFLASAYSDLGGNISGAFIMDMIGYSCSGGNLSTVISDGVSDGLYTSMMEARARYDMTLEVDFVMDPTISFSDHWSFWSHGYSSVLVIEELDAHTGSPVNPFYHTSWDTADMLSEGQMAAVSKMILGALLDLTDQGEDSYAESNVTVLVLTSMIIIVAVPLMILYLRSRRGVE